MVDLAANAPGQSALAKADELRASEVARWRALVETEHRAAVDLHLAAVAEEARRLRRHEARTAMRRRTWWGRLTLRLAPPPPFVPGPVPPRPEPVPDDPPATSSDLWWRVGAEGEQQVGALLRTLEPRWRALHAVPVGRRGSDLDHVVLGPGGVLVVNTKTLLGRRVEVDGRRFVVDGGERAYVDSSGLELYRLERALRRAGTTVKPTWAVIAVLGASSLAQSDRPTPDGITVIRAEDLVGWLSALPEVLPPDTVESLHDRLRWSDVWR